MSPRELVRLGDVATIVRKTIAPERISDGTTYVGLENIERGGALLNITSVSRGDLASTKFEFTADQVLFGKLRPYLAKVARPDFSGVCSTDILPITPGPRLDKNYLAQYLVTPDVVALAASRATGANLPRLNPGELAKFEIPLPPLEEQRRIAAILDQADDLRAKRREALAHLDDLAQSIFLDMFGDPVTNGRGWDVVRFAELLARPLRNGVSPSRRGTVTARVLTLSAVTGRAFRSDAHKEGPFERQPPPGQCVHASDFLICRGNGNIKLVGRGFFATQDMPEVVFPDTIIAAQLDLARVSSAFLEHLWNSTAVRRQIESLARTTNGTFKVNQTMLENVTLLSPPQVLQNEFSERAIEMMRLKEAHGDQVIQLDSLFASLQSRAFAGDL